MDCLQQIIVEKALRTPHRLAACFLDDRLHSAQSLTCSELVACAYGISERLKTLASEGDVALLLYPAGLEFVTAFLGTLMAGVIAVPAPGLDAVRSKRTLPRLHGILETAQPSVVMTTLNQRRQCDSEYTALFHEVPHAVLDTDLSCTAASFSRLEATQHRMAYLQYTSGSTSQPRGVVITHDNVLENCRHIAQAISVGADSVMLNWLPHYHDLGLVAGILLPLICGIPLYLMSPVSFLKRPLRWLEAMSRYHATHSQAPNFAFDLCVRAAAGEHVCLDLRNTLCLAMGGEPVRLETIRRFNECFSPSGLSPRALAPGYGLAEATLVLASREPDDEREALFLDRQALGCGRVKQVALEHGVPVVQCGRPYSNLNVRIVSPDSARSCAPDEVGEIWVSGTSIAPGYWKALQETSATFNAYISDCMDGPFLRTGDLGFLHDERLYVTGRLKDLLIIHGENHYPQDLEWAAEQAHHLCRGYQGAAFAIDGQTDEIVALAQEISACKGNAESVYAEIAESIRCTVAEMCGVSLSRIILLRRGVLPKTSSNKIQRGLTRQLFLNGELNALYYRTFEAFTPAPAVESDSVESRLQQLFRIALKRSSVPRDAHFFAMGGDSLDYAELCARVEQEFGVTLPVDLFRTDPSIAGFFGVIVRDVSPLTDRNAPSAPLPAFGDGQGAMKRFRDALRGFFAKT